MSFNPSFIYLFNPYSIFQLSMSLLLFISSISFNTSNIIQYFAWPSSFNILYVFHHSMFHITFIIQYFVYHSSFNISYNVPHSIFYILFIIQYFIHYLPFSILYGIIHYLKVHSAYLIQYFTNFHSAICKSFNVIYIPFIQHPLHHSLYRMYIIQSHSIYYVLL